MRVRQLVGVALVSAAAVVIADLLMHSSLLRMLRPQIVSPADGAIVSGPVTVRWQGPQPMQAVLTGNGLTINLGRRESPFEIDPSRFPRPGQYALQLTMPRFGGLVSADRHFLVRRASSGRAVAAANDVAPPVSEPSPPPTAEVADLVAERDRLRVDLAALQTQVEALRDELTSSDEALDAAHADADARAIGAQAEQDALAREHALALEENEGLRLRLQSIPPCVVWGYLAVPRPQTSPPSRFILVSNRRGEIFRSESQCLVSRRGDPTGVSGCVCVGTIWQ